jgi:hypothetical protein
MPLTVWPSTLATTPMLQAGVVVAADVGEHAAQPDGQPRQRQRQLRDLLAEAQRRPSGSSWRCHDPRQVEVAQSRCRFPTKSDSSRRGECSARRAVGRWVIGTAGKPVVTDAVSQVCLRRSPDRALLTQ